MLEEYEVVTDWPTGNCPACGDPLQLVDVYADEQRTKLRRNYWACSECDWRELNHVAGVWPYRAHTRF